MDATTAPKTPGSDSGPRHAACAGLALASAALVWLAFPPVDFGMTAWVALVPLLLLTARARPGRAALWTFAGSFLMFVALLHWLRYVTAAGWIALACYCALYWPLLALLVSWLRRKGFPLLLTAPLLFTALEYVRATFLTGFPFLLLGHTQHQYLPMIQAADLTGVYGVTFVIVAVNAGVAETVLSRGKNRAPAAIAGALLFALIGYGAVRMLTIRMTPGMTVTLAQGNISQDLKHSPSLDDAVDVLERHVRLTEEIREKPDLVVWAETMFPAPVSLVFDSEATLRMLASTNKEASDYGQFMTRCRAEFLRAARAVGAPVLVGSETYSPENGRRYNSAYLISPDGRILGRYDKMHLVVFGEYTPLTNVFPFLRGLRPSVMGEDLAAGRLPTLFQAPLDGESSPKFGVTICYEDAEAGLFRRFVRDGAEFMFNITNDGWFRNSTELDEHLAICAFRAVENRIPVARCTNTGISAFITPTGEIASRLVDSEGRDRDIEGTLTARLMMSEARGAYTRIGDLFAGICMAASALLILAGVLLRRGAKSRGA
jgi:apolipoprotein N-acyltransferase